MPPSEVSAGVTLESQRFFGPARWAACAWGRSTILSAVLYVCAPVLGAAPQVQPAQQRADAPEGAAITSRAPDSLRQFNTSLVSLTNRVSPSVVQVMVTGYGPALEEGDRYNVSHQRRIGAGVIVDPEGYILTNVHVIEGAQRIRVSLSEVNGSSPFDMPAVGKRRILEGPVLPLR